LVYYAYCEEKFNPGGALKKSGDLLILVAENHDFRIYENFMRMTLAGKHWGSWIDRCEAPSGWKGVKVDLKKGAEFFTPSYPA
jgi:hypothetical protein